MSSLVLRRKGPVALLVPGRPPIHALDRQTLAELGNAVTRFCQEVLRKAEAAKVGGD